MSKMISYVEHLCHIVGSPGLTDELREKARRPTVGPWILGDGH
jgi:hypothetical protein